MLQYINCKTNIWMSDRKIWDIRYHHPVYGSIGLKSTIIDLEDFSRTHWSFSRFEIDYILLNNI